MTPTVEPPPERWFAVQLHTEHGGWSPTLRFRADTACDAQRLGSHAGDIVFKRDGETVATVIRRHVVAWWIEERTPAA